MRINFFEATKQTACIFSKGEETGVNYYGARYLDPKYSRWLSGDPALSDYIPKAPIDDESKKHNENLPGMGGVFNVVNLHLYHYAGNNPVKYTDPDGKANKPYINLHDPRTADYAYSERFEIPKGNFAIFAHGNISGVFDHSGTIGDGKISAKKLADAIKSNPNYRKGMIVQLVVCNVGLPNPKEDGVPYAQKVADELGEGSKVLAPEGTVNVYEGFWGKNKGKIDYFISKPGATKSVTYKDFKEFIGHSKKEEVK